MEAGVVMVLAALLLALIVVKVLILAVKALDAVGRALGRRFEPMGSGSREADHGDTRAPLWLLAGSWLALVAVAGMAAVALWSWSRIAFGLAAVYLTLFYVLESD